MISPGPCLTVANSSSSNKPSNHRYTSMNDPLLKIDSSTRRQFVQGMAATAFGLNILPTALSLTDDPIPTSGPGFGSAKRVIVLQLDGGMSHIDTFDPKRGNSKGPGKTIKTSADFQVTEYLPETAKLANKICVIRSMTAEVGVHAPAKYVMRTGYAGRGTVVHPNMGAWAQHYLGRSHQQIPSSVCINRRSDRGNGFFPSNHAPLAIGEPNAGIGNIEALAGDRLMRKRIRLLNALDSDFRKNYPDKQVQAYNGYYDDALALMKSSELDAFDLQKESEDVRTSYGDSRFGQGCLLARRLVQSGVRFVEIAHDGWDMHNNLADDIVELTPVFDQAYTALLRDLENQGMLDDTLVVVSTEFGRKPKFEGNGRGHHPVCFSTVLAGAGVKRGYVHGTSDDAGEYVDDDDVTIGNFHATIGWAMGLPLSQEAVSPSGRPFTVGDKEQPVMDLFA